MILLEIFKTIDQLQWNVFKNRKSHICDVVCDLLSAYNTEHTSSQESVETSIAKRHTHFEENSL